MKSDDVVLTIGARNNRPYFLLDITFDTMADLTEFVDIIKEVIEHKMKEKEND